MPRLWPTEQLLVGPGGGFAFSAGSGGGPRCIHYGSLRHHLCEARWLHGGDAYGRDGKRDSASYEPIRRRGTCLLSRASGCGNPSQQAYGRGRLLSGGFSMAMGSALRGRQFSSQCRSTSSTRPAVSGGWSAASRRKGLCLHFGRFVDRFYYARFGRSGLSHWGRGGRVGRVAGVSWAGYQLMEQQIKMSQSCKRGSESWKLWWGRVRAPSRQFHEQELHRKPQLFLVQDLPHRL